MTTTNKEINEIHKEYEVQDSAYETIKTISAELDLKKVGIVFAAIVVIGAVFASGLSFRTPLPKLDQELINTTDSLRGLWKASSEYASGVTAKNSQIAVLEKEVEVLEDKIISTDIKIGQTQSKIESIIKSKVSANKK